MTMRPAASVTKVPMRSPLNFSTSKVIPESGLPVTLSTLRISRVLMGVLAISTVAVSFFFTTIVCGVLSRMNPSGPLISETI